MPKETTKSTKREHKKKVETLEERYRHGFVSTSMKVDDSWNTLQNHTESAVSLEEVLLIIAETQYYAEKGGTITGSKDDFLEAMKSENRKQLTLFKGIHPDGRGLHITLRDERKYADTGVRIDYHLYVYFSSTRRWKTQSIVTFKDGRSV
jgi:hypothetical protein